MAIRGFVLLGVALAAGFGLYLNLLPSPVTGINTEAQPAVGALAPAAPSPNLISVIRVVDGDTIVVTINGAEEKVRLIGVNTPETVDPRKTVECFGREASDFSKSILSSARVRLEADPSQGDRDKYGRLLRYVFLADGVNFNLRLIEGGYAYEYTYRLPYKYQKEFKQAQKEAELNQRGLWAEGACGNN